MSHLVLIFFSWLICSEGSVHLLEAVVLMDTAQRLFYHHAPLTAQLNHILKCVLLHSSVPAMPKLTGLVGI